MNPKILPIVTVITALAFVTVARSQIELTRSTIDGGGVMFSTSGSLELSGTIGQPDAGVLTGGGFELTGGFWIATPLADCNQDGLASLLDMASLEKCLGGPGGPAATAQCRCFDLDGSGIVDMVDVAVFQTAIQRQ